MSDVGHFMLLRGAFLGIRVVLKFNVADVFGFDAE